VFSCDFFVETDWKLGNVLEKSLEDLLNTRRQKAFGERKSNLPAPCTSCRWLHRCRGGCTKDRIRDPRTQGLNYFCPAFKMFFEHADARLQKLGEAWRQEHEKDRAGRNQPCPCGSGRKRKKCCGENG